MIGQLRSHVTNRRRVNDNNNISQLFRDSFSVSQQPPIWEPPSHYSMREPVKKVNTRVWPPPYSSTFSLYPLSTHLLASVLMLATPTLHRYWRLPGPHCRGRHLSVLCSHLDITENNLRCVEIGNLLTDIRCMVVWYVFSAGHKELQCERNILKLTI